MLGSKIMMAESKIMVMESNIVAMSSRTQRRGDAEPPSVASCNRCGPARDRVDEDVVDADIVYADEDTTKSIKLKPEEVQ
jgi:hypothetical protein